MRDNPPEDAIARGDAPGIGGLGEQFGPKGSAFGELEARLPSERFSNRVEAAITETELAQARAELAHEQRDADHHQLPIDEGRGGVEFWPG